MAQTSSPNIVLINLDDADNNLFADDNLALRFPNLHRLSERALRFTNFHVTTPLCGPSRACLYRGQYAHNTGIMVNEPTAATANGMTGGMRMYRDQGFFQNDLSTWMQRSGYRTMMVGKYVHGDFLPIVPPGWDDFYSYMGSRYYEFYRLTNETPTGQWSQSDPDLYRTVSETHDAIKLLKAHANRANEQPFFLCLNPLGPHRSPSVNDPMVDVQRYADLWRGDRAPRDPNFNERDFSDKTGKFADVPRAPGSWLRFIDQHFVDRQRATLSVDDQVGQVIAEIERLGLAENTYIFVTSDNGFSLGQNRMFGKGSHFEHSSNVPLLVAGPGIENGSANHLLAHIDLAPTIIDLAGGNMPSTVDGLSFRTLIEDHQTVRPRDWREAILIENWETRRVFNLQVCTASQAMRRYDSIYVEHSDGDREYYDLSRDPFQLDNTFESLPSVQKSALWVQLRSLRNDQRPRVGFSFPTEDAILRSGVRLRGITDCSRGTIAVRLTLLDKGTGKFWDGDQWRDSFTQIGATIDHRLGVTSNWSYGFQPSQNQLPVGDVVVWVWSYDAVGRYSQPALRRFHLQRGLPESTIQVPVAGAVVSGTLRARGEAFASEQIDNVRFLIRRSSDGAYWNGQNFQSTWTFVPLPVTGNGQWSHDVNLPPAEYFAVTYAVSRQRRVQVTPQIRFFVIQ